MRLSMSPHDSADPSPRTASPRIAIVGAGFAGIAMAIRLRQAGIESFTIYEQADGVGGTWRANTYPGAACDIPSHLYSFSFEPNPDWSRSYGTQPEILAYLERCVERHGLQPFLRCRSAISRAVYNPTRHVWQIEVNGEAIEVDVLIAASGPLSRPALPAIAGLDTFAGTMFHSARWNHQADLTGRRIGVIGTGASAIQFIPEIAPRAAHLTVFQRTPPWVIPKPDGPIGPRWRRLYRRIPALQWLTRMSIYWMLEARAYAFLKRPPLLQLAMRLGKRYIDRSIADPALRAKVTPEHVMGCKRILLSNDYYRAITRENVALDTTPIREICPQGVITTDGALHEFDTLIFGTGFQVNDVPAPFEMFGMGGASLSERWLQEGPQAYLGTAIRDFPNLFMIVGPNTGLGHNSMIYMIESQVAYIHDALQTLIRTGATRIAVRADVQAQFNERLQRRFKQSVWQTGCHSWYLTASGKNTTLWPGYTFAFRRATQSIDIEDYDFAQRNTDVLADTSPHYAGDAPADALTDRPDGAIPHSPISGATHPG